MKDLRKISRAALLAMLALLALAPAASAQTTVEVTYSWTPPTTGSLVHHYIVESSVNGGPFTQIATVSANTYTISAIIGNTYILRVAGVDDQDRQGPYSQSSMPYTPELGPPGEPGRPIPVM